MPKTPRTRRFGRFQFRAAWRFEDQSIYEFMVRSNLGGSNALKVRMLKQPPLVSRALTSPDATDPAGARTKYLLNRRRLDGGPSAWGQVAEFGGDQHAVVNADFPESSSYELSITGVNPDGSQDDARPVSITFPGSAPALTYTHQPRRRCF